MNSKKREWVKNAIIIFLVIMLLLTFFSNTIMNYSLPEVSAQYSKNSTVSEQIRGSGTVEASDVFEIKAKEERMILSVNVKKGDLIEKGQVIMTLEPIDDSEKVKTENEKLEADLQTAEDALDALNLDYQKALLGELGVDYSVDYLDIKHLEEDISKAEKDKNNIAVFAAEYEKAKKILAEKNALVLALKNEKSDLEEQMGYVSSTSSEDFVFLDDENKKLITAAEKRIKEAEKNEKYYADQVAEYEKKGSGASSSEITSIKKSIDEKQAEIDALYADAVAGNAPDDFVAQINKKNVELSYLNEEYSNLVSSQIDSSINASYLKTAIQNKNNAADKVDEAKQNLVTVKGSIRKKFKVQIDAVNDKIFDAEAEVVEATAAEETAKGKADLTVEKADENIRTMKRELESKKVALEQKQQKEINDSKTNSLELQAKRDEITKAQEAVEKAKKKISEAAEKRKNAKDEITSPVAGTISQLSYVSGATITADSTVAFVELTELGYTLSFNVTNDQAKKIKVGDTAEIQYFWGGNAEAKIQSIKPDSVDPTKNKTVTFSVTGDVSPGTNLQLVIGGKGQNYECVIPNSAIREDNNGKFILTVQAKNTPLGNRFYAQRVDIEVLANDGTYSAISGAVSDGEFVITSANKPIEAGMQVRMAS